jgi:hypothetical protein
LILLHFNIHAQNLLLLNLINVCLYPSPEHLNRQLFYLPESLLIRGLVLDHMPEQDEGGLLHDQEGAVDRVHLSGVRVALPLHLKDMVDFEQVLSDQSFKDFASQLAERE